MISNISSFYSSTNLFLVDRFALITVQNPSVLALTCMSHTRRRFLKGLTCRLEYVDLYFVVFCVHPVCLSNSNIKLNTKFKLKLAFLIYKFIKFYNKTK